MKTTGIVAAVAMLAALGCTQKTETNRSVSDTGTVETSTTTMSATMPAIDTMATAQAKQDVKDAAQNVGDATKNAAHSVGDATKDAAHDVGNAARDAAHATGTAMETAGKKIQQNTKPH